MRYSAPAAVRSALRKGLALVRDGYAGKGLRGETVRWAERLADGDPIDYAKAKKMRAWFARHGVAKAESAKRLRDPKSPAAVSWLLWGADPSIPYRVTGWQDPVAPWLHGVLAEFESKRSGRRAEKNGARRRPSVDSQRTSCDFNKYRDLEPDEERGNPLYSYGSTWSWKLGSYWTVSVMVPVSDLACLRPVVQTKARLESVRTARRSGIELPAIEVGVFAGGSGWIVDGNHRLADAIVSGDRFVPVTFTFAGT
jgi:hypothetical protein